MHEAYAGLDVRINGETHEVFSYDADTGECLINPGSQLVEFPFDGTQWDSLESAIITDTGEIFDRCKEVRVEGNGDLDSAAVAMDGVSVNNGDKVLVRVYLLGGSSGRAKIAYQRGTGTVLGTVFGVFGSLSGAGLVSDLEETTVTMVRESDQAEISVTRVTFTVTHGSSSTNNARLFAGPHSIIAGQDVSVLGVLVGIKANTWNTLPSVSDPFELNTLYNTPLTLAFTTPLASALASATAQPLFVRIIDALESAHTGVTAHPIRIQSILDWLRSADIQDVLLAELEEEDGTIHRIASRPYITEPDDPDLPNALYSARILPGLELEWRAGAALRRRGAVNGGPLEVARDDGDLADWVDKQWQEVRYLYGDVQWPYRMLRKVLTARVEQVDSDDRRHQFVLRDQYGKLKNAIQSVMPVPAPSAGMLYQLLYGLGLNVTPIITEPNTAPEYRVSEPPVEDAAVNRYKNQKSFTSPGIAKINSKAQFDLNSDPQAMVTVDAKGRLDGTGTWIQRFGAALKDALTRTADGMTGIAAGGSENTIQLSDDASTVSGSYVGNNARKWRWQDAAVGDHTTAESRLIMAYDGPSRVATLDSDWTTAAQKGDPYRVSDVVVQAGPMVPDEIDDAAFSAFDAAWPYLPNMYIDDGRTTAEQMLDLALAPYGWHAFTSGFQGTGAKLAIGLLQDPDQQSASFSLDTGNLSGPLRRRRSRPRMRRLRLGFAKNNTVQRRDVASHDADAQRSRFVTEEFRYVAMGSFQPGKHPAESDVTIETLIAEGEDAQEAMEAIWDLFRPPRLDYVAETRALEALYYGIGAISAVTDPVNDLNDKHLVTLGMRWRPIEGDLSMDLWG